MIRRTLLFSLMATICAATSQSFGAMILAVDLNGAQGSSAATPGLNTTSASGWSGWNPGNGASASTTISGMGISIFKTRSTGTNFDGRSRNHPNADNPGGLIPSGLGLMYRDLIFINQGGTEGVNVLGVTVTNLLPNTTYEVTAYAYDNQGAGRTNFTATAPDAVTGNYDPSNFPSHVPVSWTAGFNSTTSANLPPAGAVFQITTSALGVGSFYAWGGDGPGGNTNSTSTYLNGFSISSLASPDIDPAVSSVPFLNRIAGTAAAQAVTLNEVGGALANYTSSVSGDAIVTAGGSGSIAANGSGSITVGIGTASAGAKSGIVTINDGNPDVDQISVSGDVFDPSSGAFLSNGGTSLTLDFGTFAKNSGLQSLSEALFNVLQTAGYTAGLDLDSVVGGGDTSVLFTDLAGGDFSALAAGEANAHSFLATFDTNNAPGTYSATYSLGLSDADAYLGASAADSQTLSLTLTGTIIPEPSTLILLTSIGLLFIGQRKF